MIRTSAVLGLALLAAGSFAADVRSGLPVGATTQSIPVSDVTGPYKGERICYVCEFEAAPNVLAFLRDASEENAQLIVALNQLYLKHKARNFHAVVMVVAGAETKPWLEDLNRSRKLEIPLTFFTKGPRDPAARVYNLNPGVRNTFLVTVNRTVAANISDIGPGEFGQVAEAADRVLAGVKP